MHTNPTNNTKTREEKIENVAICLDDIEPQIDYNFGPQDYCIQLFNTVLLDDWTILDYITIWIELPTSVNTSHIEYLEF